MISYGTYLYYLVFWTIKPENFDNIEVPINPFKKNNDIITKYDISECDETFDKESAKINYSNKTKSILKSR